MAVVELPALGPVTRTRTGAAVPGFPSAGEEALEWWRTLRAAHEDTGRWPVIVDARSIAMTGEKAGPGQPAELDATEILNPGGVTLDSLGDEGLEDLLDQWPDDPCRVDRFGLPFSREPAVALFEVEHGWQVPDLLGYGDWNRCPPPAVHTAVLRHWERAYGAELVCLTWSSLELTMSRPPRTRRAALALAWEYAGYCEDSVDAIYGADNLAELAASFLDAEVLTAWWD
jgi:hypothetical protein